MKNYKIMAIFETIDFTDAVCYAQTPFMCQLNVATTGFFTKEYRAMLIACIDELLLGDYYDVLYAMDAADIVFRDAYEGQFLELIIDNKIIKRLNVGEIWEEIQNDDNEKSFNV